MCFDINDQQYKRFAKAAPDSDGILTEKLIILTFSGDFANILQQACLANAIEGGAEKSVVSSFAGLSLPSLPVELTPLEIWHRRAAQLCPLDSSASKGRRWQ